MGVTDGGNPVQVAIVGAGAMGAEHARAFADVPGVTIAGIHSRTPGRAERLAEGYGATVHDSVRALYESTRAHLVVIAVPVLATATVAEACLGFPWTILLEKPPGRDLAEATALEAAARRLGRRVYVALNRAFLSSTQAALADLARRPGPRHIHILDQQSRDAAAAAGHPREVVSDWMFANSIHLVDHVRLFARGKLVSLQIPLPWNDARPSTLLAVMRFESGDSAVYEAIWNGPGPWVVSVNTPERRWELRPLECARYQDAGMREMVGVPSDEWDRSFKPGLRRQAAEAVRVVRGEPSSAPSLAEAVATMRLIHAIYRGGGDR